MTETTGYEAQTIHRLLELNGMPEEERDGHSANSRGMRRIRWRQM